nr:CHY zinc finger protein [Paenibacillus sp. FJAT-26967]
MERKLERLEPIVTVTGAIDQNARCRHYHADNDIVGIKFKCCDTYYGCYQCHQELAGHPSVTWKRSDRNAKAVLCGNCASEMSIRSYLECGDTCPYCRSLFNPGCKKHYSLYFEE